MTYTVLFEREGFVSVSVSSPCTREDHYAALRQAVSLCQEHDCKRLLVDLHGLNTETFSIIGCFSFGETLAKSLDYLKIAHVLPVDSKARENVQFTSTVAANRGKLTADFEAIEEANCWLLSE